MMTIRMRFYVTIDDTGIYHVQNVVMGHFGQLHTHTKEDFERWSRDIDPEDIIFLDPQSSVQTARREN